MNHGASKTTKCFNGRVIPKLELLSPSKLVLDPNKKLNKPSILSTACLITISCAQWDFKSGSSVTAFITKTERPISIEIQTMDWSICRIMKDIHASESTMKQGTPAQITSWSFWWSWHIRRELLDFSQRTTATTRSRHSLQHSMVQTTQKQWPTHIEMIIRK